MLTAANIKIGLLTVLFVSACSNDAGSKAAPPTPAEMKDGDEPTGEMQDTEPAPPTSMQREFQPPELADGFQRFETTPIDVPPGGSDDWAQWVGGPLDQDYDVVDISGAQSQGGHHALMYATTDAQEPGFTRLWQDTDQFTSRLMGGVGGEGGASSKLPDGVVFRVKKGSYLLVQTHYLNAQDYMITGRTVIDLKLAPVDRSRRVASLLSSTSLAIALPAHEQTEKTIDCTVQKDLQFLQISNHMHDYGKTTVTTFTDPDGEEHVLKDDPTWTGDQALNPNFTHFSIEMPGVVPKGSTLHTRCTWENTTANEVTFPSEMCVFFGFILNEADILCNDGNWSESNTGG